MAVIVPALVSTAGEVTVSNVADVNVPLFVYAAPVPEKVAVGMLMVPVSDLETPVNVCVPVLAVKVPLFVRLPPKATAAAADSLQVAPLFTVTSPVKVLVPVADEIDNRIRHLSLSTVKLKLSKEDSVESRLQLLLAKWLSEERDIHRRGAVGNGDDHHRLAFTCAALCRSLHLDKNCRLFAYLKIGDLRLLGAIDVTARVMHEHVEY